MSGMKMSGAKSMKMRLRSGREGSPSAKPQGYRKAGDVAGLPAGGIVPPLRTD